MTSHWLDLVAISAPEIFIFTCFTVNINLLFVTQVKYAHNELNVALWICQCVIKPMSLSLRGELHKRNVTFERTFPVRNFFADRPDKLQTLLTPLLHRHFSRPWNRMSFNSNATSELLHIIFKRHRVEMPFKPKEVHQQPLRFSNALET